MGRCERFVALAKAGGRGIRYHSDLTEHRTPEPPVYSLIRPLLFSLDAERAHRLTLRALQAIQQLPAGSTLLHTLSRTPPQLPVDLMGLRFPNPVGLAAGLDKDACCAGAFHALGFGFVELGTVTPRPQPGNPRPRLFRLPGREAIINRMGFNSHGLDAFLDQLRRRPRRGLVGINLGKNKDTPAERALDDYLTGLRAVYLYADYVTVNISSPNTPGLRDLQEEAALAALLAGLKTEQDRLAGRHGRRVPLALKIAPDLDDNAIDAIARLLLAHRMDAVIATNTTVTRPGLGDEPRARETGGLSGAPLRALSTQVIRRLYTTLQGKIPIIGVGGIFTAEHAWEKLVAGAELVQIYAALIYRGPCVVREIVAGLADKVRASGAGSLVEAVQGARRERNA
jgi:dihydroorotate dehydrogenase